MKERKIRWMGDSLDQLKEFPDEVKRDMGFAIFEAQHGRKNTNAKPMKGLGSGVLEIVSNHDKDTYRAVYAVKLGADIYVLHAFKKKSNKGNETPRPDMDLIKRRLKQAREQAR